MRLFDAHCDTIGKIWETGADFTATSAERAGSSSSNAQEPGSGSYHPGGQGLHVTLPGMRAAGVSAQVFASWAWTERYKGHEFETAMGEVEAVRRLCGQHPEDLVLALTGAQIEQAFAADGSEPRIAAIPGLEGTDALLGEVDNLAAFHNAGVRILTLAWHDSPFCGSTYGGGTGLTPKGIELVEACEDAGVLIDVSHASDQAFFDICRIAKRPFIASHSNCRSLCPSPRNLTDEMIREVAERGGVIGITLAPSFLSADYYRRTKVINDEFWRTVAEGTATVDEAGKKSADAEALIPRPPLDVIADHVRHAINLGGAEAVGLGGDLDGVDALPLGFEGVEDYPRVAGLLEGAGLTPAQIEKVCYRNLARLFRDTLP
ncbi:MAG: dipeptidase [Thermoleophilia bacterium]|nr:dipeptidase [Thermoleophilia bacterium]